IPRKAYCARADPDRQFVPGTAELRNRDPATFPSSRGGSTDGPRCESRKGQPNRRTRTRLAFQPDAAAQAFGDDAVDDEQSKTRRSVVAPRREERVEGLQLDLRRHSASVVGNDEFDVIASGRSQINANLSPTIARIGVGHGIHDEMIQNLPE